MGFLPTYSLSVETSDNENVTIQLPFALDFEISRKWLGSANSALLKIYNLEEATRKAAEELSRKAIFNLRSKKD